MDRQAMRNFNAIITNPPYAGSLHLDIFDRLLDNLEVCQGQTAGQMVIVEPSTWLINVRRNGKAKKYDAIKKRIEGHVKSVKIENLNADFDIVMQVPLSITYMDFSKTYDTIEFECCGEKKIVKDIYDCNLIGDYKTIWSILNKVLGYGDMMDKHIFDKDKQYPNGTNYIGFTEIIPSVLSAKSAGGDTINGESWYEDHVFGKYYRGFSHIAFHTGYDISTEKCHTFGQGHGAVKSRRFTDKLAAQLTGSKDELENWKHFIFNNKLPLFINIVLTIDQNNNSKEFLPWLVDRQYTDEEIYAKFNLTKDEIALIDATLKKFERNSPWFKRYMCGEECEKTVNVNRRKFAP